MNVIFILVSLGIIVFVVKAFTSGNMQAKNASRPALNSKPQTIKENNKFIVVSKVTHDDIKKALVSFCNSYNEDSYQAVLRLSQVNADTFVVTFPYDIDFMTFCFAVNFLDYPTDFKWKADVRAWATTKPGEEWITDKTVNKKVMLFVAKDDKEYDNVFLTTQDNIGCKLGFAGGKETQLLSIPKERYIEPSIKYQDIQQLKFEDID